LLEVLDFGRSASSFKLQYSALHQPRQAGPLIGQNFMARSHHGAICARMLAGPKTVIAAINASAKARSPLDHRRQSLSRSRITGAPLKASSPCGAVKF